jgi:hypothetical protein
MFCLTTAMIDRMDEIDGDRILKTGMITRKVMGTGYDRVPNAAGAGPNRAAEAIARLHRVRQAHGGLS